MKKYALPVPIESSEVQLFVNTNLPWLAYLSCFRSAPLTLQLINRIYDILIR